TRVTCCFSVVLVLNSAFSYRATSTIFRTLMFTVLNTSFTSLTAAGWLTADRTFALTLVLTLVVIGRSTAIVFARLFINGNCRAIPAGVTLPGGVGGIGPPEGFLGLRNAKFLFTCLFIN